MGSKDDYLAFCFDEACALAGIDAENIAMAEARAKMGLDKNDAPKSSNLPIPGTPIPNQTLKPSIPNTAEIGMLGNAPVIYGDVPYIGDLDIAALNGKRFATREEVDNSIF